MLRRYGSYVTMIHCVIVLRNLVSTKAENDFLKECDYPDASLHHVLCGRFYSKVKGWLSYCYECFVRSFSLYTKAIPVFQIAEML